MNVYYDLHIHTCLSPCGDEDMTPNNIVNMAVIKGLDVIAITDHNSAGNVKACMDAAMGTELTVIPGMEVTTSEEIHAVVLFDNLESLRTLEKLIYDSVPDVKNKPEIFGRQIYMDSEDNEVGEEEKLLITACGFDIFSLYEKVTELGGVIFPAHIDKSSFSILSNLGAIPRELNFRAVEIKNACKCSEYALDYKVIHSSDAHYLWDISERENYISADGKSIFDILCKLQQKSTF